tara:strand:+ start:945 stop:1685 length:741 start_codon:yes stop_codon:yes gene_type:complete
MKLTRSQFRKILTEATIDYVDDKGNRRAETASNLFSNNSLRLQLQGYYNDAHERILPHQMDIIGGKNPDLAKEIAHEGAINYAREDIINYIEASLASKYGNSAVIKFGDNDFKDEMPNQFVQLSDIIKNSTSKKIKYRSNFRDFPTPQRREVDVDFEDYEPLQFTTEPITAEEELQQKQRQDAIERRRRELGSDISLAFSNTVPRADYPDEATTPKGFMSLEDMLTDDALPTWMGDQESTEPPKGR